MGTARRSTRLQAPVPPPATAEPILHGNQEVLGQWLKHYWQKLEIPESELPLLAITQDRQEYKCWTGKRLNTMALGCYCYIPAINTSSRLQRAHHERSPHRHLIFVEPDMQARSIEVTIAHELIHLADRVRGTPRRHHHHGYDAIAADEAAITGYGLEDLRLLLHEESARLESSRRKRRPIRYLYECPICGKHYPRTKRYSQPVSCSSCDKKYNPHFKLFLLPAASGE